MSWYELDTTLRQVHRNLRQGLGPVLFATAMIALGTFGMSVYLAALLGFEQLAGRIDESAGVVLFLKDVSVIEAEEVRAQVRRVPGVAAAQLVSPEEVLRSLRATLNGSELELLEKSQGISLGFVVHVRVTDDHVAQLEQLSSRLAAVEGVEEASHPGAEFARLRTLESALWSIASFVGVLLAGVSILVIHYTAKLTLYARREELTLLKLVGATDNFIRVPLLLIGGLQGLCGTVIALGLMALSREALTIYIGRALEGIAPALPIAALSPPLAMGLIFAGTLLGMGASSLSLERFLRV